VGVLRVNRVGLGEGIGVGGSAAAGFSASLAAGVRSANSLTPDVPQPNIAPSKKTRITENNRFLTTLYLFFYMENVRKLLLSFKK
jgi:hypothetical protein